ncbi:YiiX/YebB-like N1pC/P60 family cysteine hydrolase [Oceanobacillus rekensis]|uniref:YiiX/YebB-like N1pC/P60 family cysteine hydrolase n=1 Tax=Oceanobacillus rekensis TaxID=937927 RepID=UPI000B4470A7|nr:YiiX/YebB-like N1pC/P60 family cysteine hydrolase [Oceanobacillus rekensis]
MKDRKIKTVYVLLTDTGTLLTKIIKWYTNAPYNHVSIVFDEELNEIYSFGRKYPRNPLIAGYIREDVYIGTYRYFYNTRCQLLRIDISREEYIRIKKVIQSFNKNKDIYSYNLLGLIGVAIHHPINQRNKYFCSQFVSEVFEKSGLKLWDLPPALVTPNEFLMHPRFESVYEGRLYDYPLLDKNSLYAFQVNQFHKRGVTYE